MHAIVRLVHSFLPIPCSVPSHPPPPYHGLHIVDLYSSERQTNALVSCHVISSSPFAAHRISFSFRFCSIVKLVGNLTLYVTMKLPRSFGFLLRGMPRLGKLSLEPGWVGPLLSRLICLPSMVVTVRRQPVRASLRSKSMLWRMLSPSRVNRGCAFCLTS